MRTLLVIPLMGIPEAGPTARPSSWFAWALAGHVLRLCGRLTLLPVGHADGRVGGGESSAPAGMARRPAEFALGLGVRGAAGLGTHDDRRFAGDQSREPGREAARRL